MYCKNNKREHWPCSIAVNDLTEQVKSDSHFYVPVSCQQIRATKKLLPHKMKADIIYLNAVIPVEDNECRACCVCE